MSPSFQQRGRNALAATIGTFFPPRKVDSAELRREWAGGKIRKVLIIRPHQGLGDLLLASPIFRSLKFSRPDTEVHFLADTYNVLAVRNNPRLDCVWSWDKKSAQHPWRLWKFARQLRGERFDLAIVLSSHVPSFTSFLLGKLSGARILLAFSTKPFYGGANWSHYLADAELDPPEDSAPEWHKFMELVRPLGVENEKVPEFGIPKELQRAAAERWQTLELPTDKRKVGIFVGGNPDRPERLWPVSHWVALSKWIQVQPDLQLVAIVPPAQLRSGSRALEKGFMAQLKRELIVEPPAFADSDLVTVAAFLQGVDLFICPDGGLFHVAVASRVRTLGLFFGSDPFRWVSPVEWASYLRSPTSLPASLVPEAVISKIREILKQPVQSLSQTQ